MAKINLIAILLLATIFSPQLWGQEGESNSRLIYIVTFKPFRGTRFSLVERQISAKLKRKIEAYNYKIVSIADRGIAANLKIARTNNARFLIGGFYQKKDQNANLSIYGQIYNPESGYLIDAINVENDYENFFQGIKLDKKEMAISDDKSQNNFVTKISNRIRTNIKRAEKRENIDEYVKNSKVRNAANFPIQKEKIENKIEEVFNIFKEVEIVSASKKAQKISEAPASVIVITAETIKRKGYTTIIDALRDVSMIDINAPGAGYLTDIGGRGINNYLNMGKYWQILIDGHDMTWRQFYRNYLSPAWLSIENVKRIEIVKGPNSALWGANAVLGVINIITKSADDIKGWSADIGGGMNRVLTGNVSIAKPLGDDGQVFATVSYFNESFRRKIKEWSLAQGSDYFVDGSESKYVNAYSKIRFGEFSLKGMYGLDNSHKPLTQFSVGATNTLFQINKYFTDFEWQRELSKKMEVKASYYYDVTEWGKSTRYEDNPFNGPTTDPGNPEKSTTNGLTRRFVRAAAGSDNIHGLRSFVNYDIKKNMSVIVGTNFEYRFTTLWYFPEVNAYNNLPVPKYETYQVGLYSQYSYSPIKMLNLNAGARVDYDSIYKARVSPRAGYILKPWKQLVWKFMYGQAYKAPSIFELYYSRKNATYGNPELKPELNQTYETQLIYTPLKWLSSKMTLYRIEMKDIIVYQGNIDRATALIGSDQFDASQRPSGTGTYRQQVNKDDYTSHGIELELDVQPVRDFIFSFNGTYREAKDVNKDTELNSTATVQFAASGTYILKENYSFTMVGRYVSAKKVLDSKLVEPGDPFQLKADNTLQADAYFIMNFAFVASNLANKFDILIKVDNILNSEYYDAGNFALYNQPGIQAYFKLSFHMF